MHDKLKSAVFMKKQQIENRGINLTHTFDQALRYLEENGEIILRTEKGKQFTAKAGTTTKSKLHPNEPFIGFHQKCIEYARSYRTDWGNLLSSSGTIIGMYCQALDSSI
jgi:hypothetical protein